MAMLKFGHAVLINKVVCPGKWVDKVVPKGRLVVAKDVIAKFDPSKWLLSHATIMASVDVERECEDPRKNFLIKPEYSVFVNNNGDSWERDLLKKASKTFLGADNFCEHVQIPELSKGKIIDVALREVPFCKSSNGEDLTTLYVDILIATNKGHKDLIEKIQSNEYNATSMGCLIQYSICSQCGRIAEDESEACKHVKYFKGNHFYDKNGVKRIVAELCGSSDNPESCKFIDASWVRKPAFEGAVLNKILPFDVDLSEKLQKAVAIPSFEYMPGMYLKAASDAASLYKDVRAQEEAAPEPPKDDFGFPDAPPESEKSLSVDTPPDEGASAETPPVEAAPGGADSLGLGGGVAPEPQIQEPKEDATVSEVKDMIKRQLLNQMRREIMKEEAKEQSEQRPTELEDASNDNLVQKMAGYKKVLASAKKLKNDRLYNGLMILSNLKDWKKLKRYGYNRDDAIGLLHFIDRNVSDKPVGMDAIKALSKVKLGSDGLLPFFTKIIVEIGRKPSAYEGKKLASWGKILNQI